jgi:hypothetical protein
MFSQPWFGWGNCFFFLLFIVLDIDEFFVFVPSTESFQTRINEIVSLKSILYVL